MCDKLYRLRTIDQVLQHWIKNIKDCYYPGENLSIDESMLLYIRIKYSSLFCKNTVCNEIGRAFSVVYRLLNDYLGKEHLLHLHGQLLH